MHDVVLCLLITMMIISLFKMAARLVSRVHVTCMVAAFVAIAAFVLITFNHVDHCSCIDCSGNDDRDGHYDHTSKCNAGGSGWLATVVAIAWTAGLGG